MGHLRGMVPGDPSGRAVCWLPGCTCGDVSACGASAWWCTTVCEMVGRSCTLRGYPFAHDVAASAPSGRTIWARCTMIVGAVAASRPGRAALATPAKPAAAHSFFLEDGSIVIH